MNKSELQNPQVCRNKETLNYPTLIELSVSDKESIYKKLSDINFIVPCEFGEESDFINEDDFLENFDIVCKSASLTKGSEYDNVVLYKFGGFLSKNFPDTYFKQLLNFDGFYNSINPGQQFKLNYFFNKLYVAITRAKEQLFIVDTKKGISHFWDQVHQSELLNTFLLNEESGQNTWANIKLGNFFTRKSNIAEVNDQDPASTLQSAIRDMDDGILTKI